MSERFVVETETFTGPLDLLLQLVTKRKLFINDISLASVADEYIAYVQKMGAFPVAEVAQFIVVASTLLLIKSKSLLPVLELTEDEEEDIESLQRRLEQYRRIKEQTKVIDTHFGARPLFQRKEIGDAQRVIEFTPSDDLTLMNLVGALKDVIATFPVTENLPERTVEKVMSLEEMIDTLRDRIQAGISMSFKEFAGGSGAPQTRAEKVNVVVSFLAMLELVKEGVLAVRQDTTFADIAIEKNNE